MLINHLIIGALEAEGSAIFYCNVFGYRRSETFIDTGTGRAGIVLRREIGPDLLIVSFEKQSLPSPQHIAFEVTENEFDEILENCRKFRIRARADAPLDYKVEGVNAFMQGGSAYVHFYCCDPSNINLEVMKRQRT